LGAKFDSLLHTIVGGLAHPYRESLGKSIAGEVGADSGVTPGVRALL